jgi:hypothetical protein
MYFISFCNKLRYNSIFVIGDRVFTLRQDLKSHVTCVKLYALQYYFVLRLLAELKPTPPDQNCDR